MGIFQPEKSPPSSLERRNMRLQRQTFFPDPRGLHDWRIIQEGDALRLNVRHAVVALVTTKP
jgi:hypothetical protein